MQEKLKEIANELKEHEVELHAASIEYAGLAEAAAEKRVLYDVAWSSAYLRISGDGEKRTIPVLDALVTVEVEEQMWECRLAEGAADAGKRHLSSLQSLLTSGQTRAGLLKSADAGQSGKEIAF